MDNVYYSHQTSLARQQDHSIQHLAWLLSLPRGSSRLLLVAIPEESIERLKDPPFQRPDMMT